MLQSFIDSIPAPMWSVTFVSLLAGFLYFSFSTYKMTAKLSRGNPWRRLRNSMMTLNQYKEILGPDYSRYIRNRILSIACFASAMIIIGVAPKTN